MQLKNLVHEEYGEKYYDHLLEQWKTCVEMANSNSEKRISTNNVFISINAALFAIISFSLDYKSILLSAIGIVVCALWLNSISSYKKINSVKYQIINEIETLLPVCPYAYEWALLGDDNKYKRFTHIERMLPIVFIGMFAIAILVPTISSLVEHVCL